MYKNWLKIEKETIFTGKDENGNRYLSQFLADYGRIFSPAEINAGCERCLHEYYNKLITYINKMGAKKESGFVLKAKYNGIPLEFGSPVFVCNANMTDEYGKKLLKNHPRGEELFEKVPEKKVKDNGNELKTEKKPSLKSFSRAKLNERAVELGLDPKEYPNKNSIAEAISQIEELEVNASDEEE